MDQALVPGADTLASDGIFPVEHDGDAPFLWTRALFTLYPPAGQRYLALYLGRADSATRLTAANHPSVDTTIAAGWHWYSFDLGSVNQKEVELTVAGPAPDPRDTRELGVMLRSVVWHDSSERHSRMESVRANSILNAAEYQSGAAVMRSVPPHLHLTMEVRCNIANDQPCVYCAWKFYKNEEIGSPTYDLPFIKSLDSYFSVANQVTDCSIAEPTLHREFAQIVDLLAAEERTFTFTSNGTTLRRKVRQALLGRKVNLYISLDSATSAGFARYRDDSFDRIVADLRTLCQEKKQHGNLPFVTLSLVLMNSNKSEVRDVLALMQSIGVDRVKFLGLHREDCMDLDGRVQQRGDFVFNYEQETIPLDELDSISREAQKAADEFGISLYLDWNDFPAHHGSGAVGQQPLCSEPWKSLYVLNRGIMPCSYARKPLARWTERGDRSVEQFVEDTRNGPAFQEIRRSLAKGVFPAYCLATHSCPIVHPEINEATRDGSGAGVIGAQDDHQKSGVA